MAAKRMIAIQNKGAEILTANYWESERENLSQPFASFYLGCFRLLLPRLWTGHLDLMKQGREVEVVRWAQPESGKGEIFEFRFLAGSRTVFSLQLDAKGGFDRLPGPAAYGEPGRVSVWGWSETGPIKTLELPARLEREDLPTETTVSGSLEALDFSARVKRANHFGLATSLATRKSKKLKNGSLLEWERTDVPTYFDAQPTDDGFGFAADGMVARFKMKTRDRKTLAGTAQLAGEALAAKPLRLLLLLAFTTLHGKLPERLDLKSIDFLTKGLLLPKPEAPLLSDNEIQTFARQHVHAAAHDLESLALPDGNWNAARAILTIAQRLWTVSKEQGYYIGTLDHCVPNSEVYEQALHQQKVLIAVAGLGLTSEIRARLPIQPHPGTDPPLVFADWISLCWGPNQPPGALRPAGLGHLPGILGKREAGSGKRGLPDGTIKPLLETASTLLERVSRPIPHFYGRLFDVPVPVKLIPQTANLGVSFLRIQVETAGLWVGLFDAERKSVAATFWKAETTAFQNVPVTFTVCTWILTHAICSALWHDLCNETVQLPGKASGGGEITTEPNRNLPTGKPSSVVNLPIRSGRESEPAIWATPAEVAVIAESVKNLGRDYRRLPEGWEARRVNVDWQKRQERAGERARSYGCPAPPPGWTFVRPFSRKRVGVGTGQPRIVKSTGLFALALSLAEVGGLDS
ncbi:MAG: hypothetical protein K1Y36_29460 [Blastocatellia bacterium]|nr:hypothetical protein [Blastocatellia bacterium]